MKTIQFILSILVSICAAGMLYGGYHYLQSYENILYHYNECYMCRVCVAHENNL